MKTLWQLTWDDVDRHSFETEGLGELLGAHLANLTPPEGPAPTWFQWRGREIARLNELLSQRCGEWAVGWNFTASDGGPVRSWCCSEHSFFPRGFDSAAVEPTVEAIMAGLSEWRAHLEMLAELFAELSAKRSAAQTPQAALEHAAGTITLAIIEVTTCDDAWHHHAERVLAWYLRHKGISNERARWISSEALKGRFDSWVTPDEDAQREAASAFARAGALALDDLTERTDKGQPR